MKAELVEEIVITVELAMGFDAIGERVSGGWRYDCAKPGCTVSNVVPRRYVKEGMKGSRWYVCFAEDENGKVDTDTVLTFCPTHARVVLE